MPPATQKHEVMHSFWKILTISDTSTHGVPARQQSHIPSSVVSSESMYNLGVLATASHAIMTNTMFTVYYKQSFFGRVVGIGDFSPEWPNSKWRCLKVQWDEPATVPRPEEFSPWEIEAVAHVGLMYFSDPISVEIKSSNPIHNAYLESAPISLVLYQGAIIITQKCKLREYGELLHFGMSPGVFFQNV